MLGPRSFSEEKTLCIVIFKKTRVQTLNFLAFFASHHFRSIYQLKELFHMSGDILCPTLLSVILEYHSLKKNLGRGEESK